jgi:hypothetical protein
VTGVSRERYIAVDLERLARRADVVVVARQPAPGATIELVSIGARRAPYRRTARRFGVVEVLKNRTSRALRKGSMIDVRGAQDARKLARHRRHVIEGLSQSLTWESYETSAGALDALDPAILFLVSRGRALELAAEGAYEGIGLRADVARLLDAAD